MVYSTAKYRIGFSGTQHGMTDYQKVKFLEQFLLLKKISGDGQVEFHQGQCKGADKESLMLAKSQAGVWTVSHPPTDKSKVHEIECDEEWPEKPYLERNQDIVGTVDFMIFAPKEMEEELRSGTWSTYRYARKRRRPGVILWPERS